jgi:DNA-binding protein HU-beta
MTRALLARQVAQKLDMTVGQADRVILTVLEVVINGMVVDGKVILRKFGKFFVQQKKERWGRNPRTGEKARISARKRAAFKPSKFLKERLNDEPRS